MKKPQWLTAGKGVSLKAYGIVWEKASELEGVQIRYRLGEETEFKYNTDQ